MSPPITTAEPSAAPSVAPSTVPSAATSPMALSAVVSGQNKAIPPVPQLPPTSAAFQNQHQPGLVLPPASAAAQGIAPSYNLQQQQQQPSSGNSTATFVPSTTPILPPIASTTSSSSSRPSPPLITPKGHAALLPVPQIQPQPQPQPPSQFHLQLPHSGLHLARKPPAQSMPNSPSFQAASGGRIGDFLLGQKTQGSSTFGTHPFFNSNPGTAANSVLTPTSTHDIPSIRHHLHSGTNDGYSLPVASQQQQQLNNGSGYQQQQQNAAGMPIRKSSLNSPQYRQHPYGSTNGRPIPVAQSLQNTPLMRPNRESSLGEGIELPPISFGSRTVLPPPQQPPVLSLPPPLQHQQHQQQH
ncbi:hypothetical protein GGI12_005344 [Dipsacomyces acuminosporus]|nr:hypothetical protein GGI12_005344 [Dipsacomyces acuminosporus]